MAAVSTTLSYPNISELYSTNISLNNVDQFAKLHEMVRRMRRENIMQSLALTVVFSFIVLLSMFGNSLVVLVIVRNKRMHTVTNIFITNLAICDLLITLLNIPFNIVRYILNDWPFGNAMCHLINYIQTISVYAFTFTLISIALDRYRVIMYPLRPRISMSSAFVLVTTVWVLASILSIPFGLWYGEEVTRISILESTRCTKIFPSPDTERYVYLATSILQYIIPLIIISAAYGRIAHHLWARVALGHVTRDQQLIHMKSKKKTIKMLIAVVLAFAVLWLPINVYYLVIHFPPPDSAIKPTGKTVFSCYWAAMFSVSVNPFIYCWFNEVFRAEILNRFRCCLRQKRRIHPGYEIDGILVRSDQVRTRTTTTRWRNESTVAREFSTRVQRRAADDTVPQELPTLEITPPEDDENSPLSDLTSQITVADNATTGNGHIVEETDLILRETTDTENTSSL